jgi:hypothetical protein
VGGSLAACRVPSGAVVAIGFRDLHLNAIFSIASMTKPVTSLAAMNARRRRKAQLLPRSTSNFPSSRR